MMPGLIAILLAVVSIICAIVALCKKSTVFGIVMIIVGLIAGGVATVGYVYSAAKDLRVMDQAKIQLELEQKIQSAQKDGDLDRVEELRKEQKAVLEQYSQGLQEKLDQ